MSRSLQERLARLGTIRKLSPVAFGDPMTVTLRPAGGAVPMRTVAAAEALATRGVSLLAAKRAMDSLVETGEAILEAPRVEIGSALVEELEVAGIALVARRP